MKPQAHGLVHFVFDRYLLLPLGTLIALVWVHLAAESYFGFSLRASFLVNEVGMALFFGLVTQEIVDATAPGGSLSSWRRWSLPLVAAAGGVLGAAVTYVLWVQLEYETVFTLGWPVAIAVDIAAAYFLLKLIFPRTSAVYPFLLLTAIVTNGVALIVIALSHPSAVAVPWAVGLIVLAVGAAAGLRSVPVRAFWPYLLLSGPLSWLGCYWAGLPPALALVPVVPFLPHRSRGLDFLEDETSGDHVRHIEHEWAYVVQPVVFLFGLVNGGVVLSSYGTSSWALLTSALVGRPAGMLLAIATAVSLGWTLPGRTGWRDLVVVALVTSAGFTMALFAATTVWPIGPALGEAKVGALLTATGALAALAAARLLHVGRFASHPPVIGRKLLARHRSPDALATGALNRMA